MPFNRVRTSLRLRSCGKTVTEKRRAFSRPAARWFVRFAGGTGCSDTKIEGRISVRNWKSSPMTAQAGGLRRTPASDTGNRVITIQPDTWFEQLPTIVARTADVPCQKDRLPQTLLRGLLARQS